MTQWDTLRLLGNIALAVCAVGALVLPIVYTLLSRWWRTPTGRYLMLLMVAVLMVFVINIVGVIWTGYAFRLILRIVLYAVVAGGLWTTVFALLRVQMRPGRHRRNQQEEDDHA